MTFNILRIGLVVATILLGIGCSPEEPIINTFVDEWRLVAARGQTEITSTVVPNGESSSINPSGVDLGSSPSMIQFRNSIYIFTPNRPWIIVYDVEKLIYTDTIFTFGQLDGVTDMCFANATTAYAVSPLNNCIGIIDLTASKVAAVITMPGSPQQIACLGNQIVATIPDSNSVVVIDSRTNGIEDRIQVGQRPWYVREDAVANVFCIVSLGQGKVDQLDPTTPTISFLSPTTREILKTLDLTVKASEGPKQLPRGLAVSATQNAFVPVQSGLLRVSTRTRSRVSSVQSDSFDVISYNDARAELICQRATGGGTPQVIVFNEDASEKKHTLTAKFRATSLLGVPR